MPGGGFAIRRGKDESQLVHLIVPGLISPLSDGSCFLCLSFAKNLISIRYADRERRGGRAPFWPSVEICSSARFLFWSGTTPLFVYRTRGTPTSESEKVFEPLKGGGILIRKSTMRFSKIGIP